MARLLRYGTILFTDGNGQSMIFGRESPQKQGRPLFCKLPGLSLFLSKQVS